MVSLRVRVRVGVRLKYTFGLRDFGAVVVTRGCTINVLQILPNVLHL